jgi:hypothetical protein
MVIRLDLTASSLDDGSLSSGTTDQQLKAATARQKLSSRIEQFNKDSSRYIPMAQYDEARAPAMDTLDESDEDGPPWEDESDESTYMSREQINLTLTAMVPETMSLNLPSELGLEQCKDLGITRLARRELRLRRGQANDTLRQLRIELGYKAFIHRTSVRNASSQQTATRARRLVDASKTSIMRLKRVYDSARRAMVRLGASDKTLEHYKVITDQDLRVSTAIQDPRVTNSAETALSWIWTVDARKETDHSDWMEECEYHACNERHLVH